jgi:type IV pilus assembly protein PilE
MRINARAKAAGFTLLELMIVVAIVAVLMSIAIPSYREYVLRAGRAEARAALVDVAARQERFRYNQPGYALTLAELSAPAASENGKYAITMAASLTTFVVTATPVDGQLQDGDCLAFSINQLGVKTATGTLGNQPCWAK